MIEMFKFMWAAIAGKKLSDIKPPPIMLHNHDLNEWNYIGRAEIHWNVTRDDSEKISKHAADVFFFVHKKDEKNRSFTIVTPSQLNFERHPWITVEAELWLAGQRDYHYPVITEPSQFLKEKMKNEHGWLWDEKAKWWSNSSDVKYELAQEKQAKKTIRKNKVVENNNVVKVDFKKEVEKENV